MSLPKILPGQLRLIIAITAVHVIAWFACLSQVPLGLYPTPPENAVMEKAFALASEGAAGDLSVSVYEFGLSIAARFLGSDEELVFAARLINALALLITTAACAHAAGQYWKRNRPVWIAGLLTGLNPILVFWSAEVSPAILALLFASLSFTQLLRWLRRPAPGQSLWIGLLLAMAIAFEPTLAPFALLWPLAAFFYPTRKRPYHLGAAIAFPLLIFMLLSVSGFQLQLYPGFNTEGISRSLYEVFNSHEPYDGKSYGLHKQLHLFLFVNPLHWGIIFMLAAAGIYIRLKNGHQGNSVAALLICVVVFAISYALNDGGSKTRAILFPILAIYAGGISMMPQIWKHAGKATKRKIVIGGLVIAGVCYSDFYGARQPANWEADYTFLAKANLALERNKSAAEWAEKTVKLNPERIDMRSIIAQARFNEWALSPRPSPISTEDAKIEIEAIRQADMENPTTRAIEALYLFKIRETESALGIWNAVKDQSALAVICLYWSGQIERPNPRSIDAYAGDSYYKLLQQTVQINRNAMAYTAGEETLDNMLATAH